MYLYCLIVDELRCRAPVRGDLAEERVQWLTALINRVYEVAEQGLWQSGCTRTSQGEVRTMLAEGQLILAELDGAIAGSVSVERITPACAEFGMLVAAPELRGRGVGTALVNAAETWARAHGYRIMQLALLTPRAWRHPSKEFLKGWYGRIGYVPGTLEAFELRYPALAGQLATPCDFTVWSKPLAT
jgi:GNAT superfamily N-acetyltransferase